MKNSNINICRAINFFNNFLPPNNLDHKWEYCAFGTFDGVNVEEAWYENESTAILKKIWDYQNQAAHNLQGEYSVQTVYAVCSADKELEQKFWDDFRFPYTFFCRMQYGGNLSSLRKNKEILEQCLNQTDKISTWIYLTYDNSDLLIVIKAASYASGAGAINEMHSDINFSFCEDNVCQLKNSFTVFALKQDFIDTVKDKKIKDELNNVKIDRVVIRLIEKKCGCIKKLEDTLRPINGMTKHILGADDEIIFFEELGWGDFLYLYCTEEGAFHNTSQVYRDYIGGATTTICTDVVAGNYFSNYIETFSESDQIWESWYKNRIDGLLKKLNNKAGKTYYKELYMILNAFPKFSGEIVSDYIFFLVLKPLETLIDLLGDAKVEDVAYYEFVKSFNMYVQSSVKSDKHTMQIMDFNTKIYDIPVKINALYIAFIYTVCDILNIGNDKQKHEYDFLVVPGAANIVNVLELYSKVSKQKRLLRVEIPENRFYDMCSIMRIFSHEVAHYVGGDLRNRRKRYVCMLHNIAAVYINYIRSYWDEIDPDGTFPIGEEEWNLITERMAYKIEDKLERELNINYVSKRQIGPDNVGQAKAIADYNKENKQYMDFLKNNLYRSVSEIGYFDFKVIFQSTLYDRYENEKDALLKKLNEVSQCFLVYFPEGSTKTTLNTVYECLMRVYEESFADLISIRLLKLSAKEYLNTLIVDAKAQNMEITKFCHSEVIYRVLLMLDILATEESNMWDEDLYNEDDLLEDRIKLINEALRIKTAIKNNQYMEKKELFRNSCFLALMNRDICNDIEEYLLQCVELVKKRIEKEQNQKHKEIYEVYRKLSDNTFNIEEHIKALENFIDLYKRTCMEK